MEFLGAAVVSLLCLGVLAVPAVGLVLIYRRRGALARGLRRAERPAVELDLDPLRAAVAGTGAAREAAVAALVARGPDVVQDLCAALLDPAVGRPGENADDLRVAIAEALGRIGDPRAYAALNSAALTFAVPVSLAALEALASLGTPEAAAVLRDAIPTSGPGARLAAVDGILRAARLGRARPEYRDVLLPVLAREVGQGRGVSNFALAMIELDREAGVRVLTSPEVMLRRPSAADEALRALAETRAAADGDAVLRALALLPPTAAGDGALGAGLAALLASGHRDADAVVARHAASPDRERRHAAAFARGHVLRIEMPSVASLDEVRRARGGWTPPQRTAALAAAFLEGEAVSGFLAKADAATAEATESALREIGAGELADVLATGRRSDPAADDGRAAPDERFVALATNAAHALYAYAVAHAGDFAPNR